MIRKCVFPLLISWPGATTLFLLFWVLKGIRDIVTDMNVVLFAHGKSCHQSVLILLTLLVEIIRSSSELLEFKGSSSIISSPTNIKVFISVLERTFMFIVLLYATGVPDHRFTGNFITQCFMVLLVVSLNVLN